LLPKEHPVHPSPKGGGAFVEKASHKVGETAFYKKKGPLFKKPPTKWEKRLFIKRRGLKELYLFKLFS
jgi:hypothetical protein